MRQNGQVVEVLDAAATLRTEPGLAALAEGLAGALHAPGDASGSCHAFASALLAHLTARGLDARFGTRILGLVEQGGCITGIWTDAGGLDADAVVVALGPDAAPFLAQHGVRVPVYPVKGYSLHVEGVDGNGGPRLDGVDKAAGIAWRRQGQEVRLTTGAVFAGQDRSLDLVAIAALRAFGERLFGPSGQVGSGQGWQDTPWAGFRPMTPTGLPVVREQQPGLWLNIGHGHMGWTMAHATAQILADSMAGRAPVMRLAGF
jgi:D-amino-acid dehydrogenase